MQSVCDVFHCFCKLAYMFGKLPGSEWEVSVMVCIVCIDYCLSFCCVQRLLSMVVVLLSSADATAGDWASLMHMDRQHTITQQASEQALHCPLY